MDRNDYTAGAAILPDPATAQRFTNAINRQRKWTPDEVMPKWSLALNVLRNEKVDLSFNR